jgi:hypothetical protein
MEPYGLCVDVKNLCLLPRNVCDLQLNSMLRDKNWRYTKCTNPHYTRGEQDADSARRLVNLHNQTFYNSSGIRFMSQLIPPTHTHTSPSSLHSCSVDTASLINYDTHIQVEHCRA